MEGGELAAITEAAKTIRNSPGMTAILIDVLIVCLSLGTWLALGYPVARKLGPSVNWPALAAAPLGLAILGTLTVIFYVSGLRIDTVFKLCIGLAIPGVVLAVYDGLRSPLDRSFGAFLVTLVIATLFVLLPKWLAPPTSPSFRRTSEINSSSSPRRGMRRIMITRRSGTWTGMWTSRLRWRKVSRVSRP